MISGQMSSGSAANSSLKNESSFEEMAVKIGGKENAKILGYEMVYGAAKKSNSKNFDLMRTLMERYHACKGGWRVN